MYSFLTCMLLSRLILNLYFIFKFKNNVRNYVVFYFTMFHIANIFYYKKIKILNIFLYLTAWNHPYRPDRTDLA